MANEKNKKDNTANQPNLPNLPNLPNQPNSASDAPARHSLDDIRARMRARHADASYDTDDDLYDALYADMDDSDHLRQREQEFTDILGANPQAGEFFAAVSEGKSPVAMLVESMGTQAVKDYLDSKDNAEELARAQQQYLSQVKKGEDFRQQYEENVKKSLAADDAAVKDGTLTEDDIDRAHASLEKKVSNYILGLWTTDDLLSELRSLDHDKDVNDARQQGEIRGRNQQISTRLRQRSQGDGMPAPTRGGGRMQQGSDRPQSIFGLAALAR